MPRKPSDSGCVSGKPEVPNSVVITGICVFSANARSSSQAPESNTPWPAMITGRDARSIRRAASFTCRIVLPVENSSAGVVQEVSDLLWETPGLRVVREQIQPVRHCLLGWPGPVERALSHPQALAQCDRYLHSRQIRPVAFHDTAGAARAVAEQRQPGTAAIASKAAAARYSRYVLAESIQDDSENRTRFVVVEKGGPARPHDAATGDREAVSSWKGSIAFVTAHRP